MCAPLVEGAFLGLGVASALGVPFTYSERVAAASARPLFPFGYHIPDALRSEVRGQRVAVVNDHGLALESLASFPNRIWEPDACPLCAQGVALVE